MRGFDKLWHTQNNFISEYGIYIHINKNTPYKVLNHLAKPYPYEYSRMHKKVWIIYEFISDLSRMRIIRPARRNSLITSPQAPSKLRHGRLMKIQALCAIALIFLSLTAFG